MNIKKKNGQGHKFVKKTLYLGDHDIHSQKKKKGDHDIYPLGVNILKVNKNKWDGENFGG